MCKEAMLSKSLAGAGAVLIYFGIADAHAAEDFLRQGIAAYQQGKYQEAIGYFGAAKGTESENPLLHYYMGNALVQVKAPGDALREYRLARDLSPGSKIASFCQTAIASLEKAKAATQPKVFQTKPPDEQWRPPLVISFLCGCTMCSSLPPILNMLYAQNKNSLIFLTVGKGASDEKSKALIKKYGFSVHPTILFVNEYGVVTKRFHELVNTAQLQQETTTFGQSIQSPAPTTADEKVLFACRKTLMDQLFASSRQEDRRMSEEFARIDAETRAKIAAIPLPARRNFDYEVFREEYETQKKIVEKAADERKESVLLAAAKRKMDCFVSMETNMEKEAARLAHLAERNKGSGAASPQRK